MFLKHSVLGYCAQYNHSKGIANPAQLALQPVLHTNCIALTFSILFERYPSA